MNGTVGAEMVLVETIDHERFNQYRWDVGVHGLVVPAPVTGLYLYRTTRRQIPPTAATPHAP